MTAGLPGTGLGGLLYLLLVAWMPFRELWMVMTGRSTGRRWKAVGLMVAMAAAIGLSLVGELWGLARGFEWINRHTAPNSWLHFSSSLGVVAAVPALALLPFVLLGLVIAALHVLRVWSHWQDGDLRETVTADVRAVMPWRGTKAA